MYYKQKALAKVSLWSIMQTGNIKGSSSWAAEIGTCPGRSQKVETVDFPGTRGLCVTVSGPTATGVCFESRLS